RSGELRRELGSVLNRYLDDVARTSQAFTASAAAKAQVREQVQKVLQQLAQHEAAIARHQDDIRVRVQLALFALVALVLGVCGGLFWLQYRLSGVATTIGGLQKRLAAGDLRGGLVLHSRFREIAELGQSTLALRAALAALHGELHERSGQVAGTSVRVMASADRLQASIEHQLTQSTQAREAVAQVAEASASVASEVAAVVAATQAADRTLTDGTRIIDSSVAGMSALAA